MPFDPNKGANQYTLVGVPNVFNTGFSESSPSALSGRILATDQQGNLIHPQDVAAIFSYFTNGENPANYSKNIIEQVVSKGIGKMAGPGSLGDFGLGGTVRVNVNGAISSGGSSGAAAANAAAVKAAQQAALALRVTDTSLQVQDTLRLYGGDLMAQLGPAAWQKVLESGGSMPAADIILSLQDTPQWKARFPGMDLRAQNGLPPISAADYTAAEQGYMQAWTDAGMDPKLFNPQAQANMIGGGVSTTEFKDRVKTAQQAIQNANKGTLQALHAYAGITPANATAYLLDPKFTSQQWQSDLAQAQVGGAGQEAGFGLVSGKIASEIAKAGYSQSQAQTGFNNIVGLQGLETAQVGQSGQAVTTRKQLIGSEFTGAAGSMGVNQADAKVARQRSIEARGAGLEGGGTFAAGAKGVAGAGRASTEGTGNA